MIFRKTIILFLLLASTSCGYIPLNNSEKISFYINEISFSGDRKVNNFILNNLKKYNNFKEDSKKYDLIISSKYEKKISNKDSSGNAKNYNIIIETKIDVTINDGSSVSKSFRRDILLEAKSKKIEEKELENKHKKDLSNLLSQDIIFFLTNNL